MFVLSGNFVLYANIHFSLFLFLALAYHRYMASAMKAARIMSISVLCFMGAIHISLKKSILPNISTGVQNTITVAMAMRMLAPQVGMRSCFAKMKNDPMRQPSPTSSVTG